jgi:sugar porter (SP) family MFS transporter
MAYQHLGTGFYVSRLWGNCFTIGLSSFYWGYYIAVLSTPFNNISETLGWGDNKTVFEAVFSALFPLGAAFGAIVGGSLTKSKGRRKALIWAAFWGIGSSIVHAIPLTQTFAIGRFSCGLAGGVMAVVPPVYVSEISPIEVSGRTGIIIQFMITFSILVAYLIGLPLPTEDYSDPMNNWWIFMLLFPILAVALQLLLFTCMYKHEPAAWLVKQGRTEEASEAAKFIYTNEQAHAYILKLTLETEAKDIELVSNQQSADTSQEQGTYAQLLKFEGKYRKMMILGVVLQGLQQWCGINAIINYSTVIFLDVSGIFMARVFTCILGLVNMAATLGGIPFVDKAGRRPLMIIGNAGMMSSHLMLGLLTVYGAPKIIAVVLICVFIIFFEISMGPIVWLYCGEIMNDKGISIAVAVNWICAAIVELIFPFITLPGMYVAFFLYGAVCAAGFVFCLVNVKETRGLNKQEIKTLIYGDSRRK